MTRIIVVMLVCALGGHRAAADPLDKAKVVQLEKLRDATVLGLHVAEVTVGDDGALRVRAGIEVKCGTVKKVKKVEGKCVTALPAGVAVSLSGSIPVGDVYADLSMTGAVDGKWLVFRADRLGPLIAAASVTSSTTDQIGVYIAPGDQPSYRTRIADWPDPYLAMSTAADDPLAAYRPTLDGLGYSDAYGDDMEGTMDCGGDGDWDDPGVYAQLPAKWLAYAGAQMLAGHQERLLEEYRALAARRPAAFYALYDFESQLAGLDAAGEPLAALATIAAGLPGSLEERATAAGAKTPSLDRSIDLYRDVRLLLEVYGAKLPADVADRVRALDGTVAALVADDVAAFAASPDVATKDTASLATWEAKYGLLLADARHPAVFTRWVEARGALGASLPFLGAGNYEGVLQAALQDPALTTVLVAAARADVASATKQNLWGLWSLQDVLTFAHYQYKWHSDAKETADLLVDLGHLLVGPDSFDADLAQAFLRAYDGFLTATDAGRDLALEMSPRIENRRRTVQTENIAALVAEHERAAKSCRASVEDARELNATWIKKSSKMKEKAKQKLRDKAATLSYQIQADRSTLDYVVTELEKLGATEAWQARSDRDACTAPW